MWDEDKCSRDDKGRFTDGGGGNGGGDGSGGHRQNTSYGELLEESSSNAGKGKKMTSAEKIASVHIDFDRDNILPELDEEDLKEMGLSGNRTVLLKTSSIQRNAERHSEVKMEDINELIGETLYSPDHYIFPGRNKEENYFSFVKFIRNSKKRGDPLYGTVLLDVNVSNKHFEIVHWHWVRKKALNSVK